MHWIDTFLDPFFGIFFPAPCNSCGDPQGAPLCGTCKSRFSQANLRATPAYGLRPLQISYGEYKGVLRDLIRGAKFEQKAGLARLMAVKMAQKLQARAGLFAPVEALITPPLERERRSFHPAFVLALELGKTFQIPVHHDWIFKKAGSPRTRHLAGAARALHTAKTLLPGNFPANRPKRVALVDDLLTTGATASRITALFAQKGIEVSLWIHLAKTPLRRTRLSRGRSCPRGKKVQSFSPPTNRPRYAPNHHASLDGSAFSW